MHRLHWKSCLFETQDPEWSSSWLDFFCDFLSEAITLVVVFTLDKQGWPQSNHVSCGPSTSKVHPCLNMSGCLAIQPARTLLASSLLSTKIAPMLPTMILTGISIGTPRSNKICTTKIASLATACFSQQKQPPDMCCVWLFH